MAVAEPISEPLTKRWKVTVRPGRAGLNLASTEFSAADARKAPVPRWDTWGSTEMEPDWPTGRATRLVLVDAPYVLPL